MEQVHKTKSSSKTEPVDAETVSKADSKEELKAEIDSILDEIDSVLEENAEEFVKGYLQKGGE